MENGGNPVSLEVIAVGPLFRELDSRWLEKEMAKSPFSRRSPLHARRNG